jgi:hypothetical protein
VEFGRENIFTEPAYIFQCRRPPTGLFFRVSLNRDKIDKKKKLVSKEKEKVTADDAKAIVLSPWMSVQVIALSLFSRI